MNQWLLPSKKSLTRIKTFLDPKKKVLIRGQTSSGKRSKNSIVLLTRKEVIGSSLWKCRGLNQHPIQMKQIWKGSCLKELRVLTRATLWWVVWQELSLQERVWKYFHQEAAAEDWQLTRPSIGSRRCRASSRRSTSIQTWVSWDEHKRPTKWVYSLFTLCDLSTLRATILTKK